MRSVISREPNPVSASTGKSVAGEIKMLIFDELKKNDPHLRLVAMVLAAGLCILIVGLWWVQVVSSREYQNHLETQAYRTVRIPAMRGKILDREGRVLAENRPRYNLSLYLDDLHDEFQKEYSCLRPVKIVTNSPPFWKLWLGSRLVKTNYAPISKGEIATLTSQARYNVANNLVVQMSQTLQQPLMLDPKNFEHTYTNSPYAPYSILSDMSSDQIARFEENFSGGLGVNLDLQSARVYPSGTTAAHLLGYLQRYDESIEGEDAVFDYRLPDYRGLVGIEGGFDAQLHGHAGTESMLINSRGYRQSENILDPPEPGDNVVLTIDLDIQRAAEKSILDHQKSADTRAAVVVMDVRSGDVLAMVSSPAINPIYVSNSPAYLSDPKLQPQINRATYGNYAPGSIFKPIVGLAALENGLNPNEIYEVQPDPLDSSHGCIVVGTRKIKDTVPPGNYDFRRAIQQSSNSYFIFNGLRTHIEKIVQLAEKFHFGERTGLPTRQESKGIFPTLNQVEDPGWRAGDSANIFFGQGEMAVTPMQMAVAYSAIANGGKVLTPRLVERIEPQDPTSGETATDFPSGLVRNEIGVSERSLKILHEAMLSETEDPEGSGYAAFHHADSILNLRVCGKTGTAQVQNEHGQKTGWNYWFASFAPYENPRYAVVVMVQSDISIGSGGTVCAPIAHDIYEAILKKENAVATKIVARN
jgi:penicillin-binding protein 2